MSKCQLCGGEIQGPYISKTGVRYAHCNNPACSTREMTEKDKALIQSALVFDTPENRALVAKVSKLESDLAAAKESYLALVDAVCRESTSVEDACRQARETRKDLATAKDLSKSWMRQHGIVTEEFHKLREERDFLRKSYGKQMGAAFKTCQECGEFETCSLKTMDPLSATAEYCKEWTPKKVE